jgi:Mn-containing catalase
LGAGSALPIPNDFDTRPEKREFSHVFLGTAVDGTPPPQGRFSNGRSLDGTGQFTAKQNVPLGQEPQLGPARANSGAQREQEGMRQAAE